MQALRSNCHLDNIDIVMQQQYSLYRDRLDTILRKQGTQALSDHFQHTGDVMSKAVGDHLGHPKGFRELIKSKIQQVNNNYRVYKKELNG